MITKFDLHSVLKDKLTLNIYLIPINSIVLIYHPPINSIVIIIEVLSRSAVKCRCTYSYM